MNHYTALTRPEIRALRRGFVDNIKKLADKLDIVGLEENIQQLKELQGDCPHDALTKEEKDRTVTQHCSDCGVIYRFEKRPNG